MIPPNATDAAVAWCVCVSSVTFVQPTKAIGRNAMPLGGDTHVVPSNSVLDRGYCPPTVSGDLSLEHPVCRNYFGHCLRATCRLQWSSGNMPDCRVRGPRFESHRGLLHVYRKNRYDIQPWAQAAHPYCSA